MENKILYTNLYIKCTHANSIQFTPSADSNEEREGKTRGKSHKQMRVSRYTLKCLLLKEGVVNMSQMSVFVNSPLIYQGLQLYI